MAIIKPNILVQCITFNNYFCTESQFRKLRTFFLVIIFVLILCYLLFINCLIILICLNLRQRIRYFYIIIYHLRNGHRKWYTYIPTIYNIMWLYFSKSNRRQELSMQRNTKITYTNLFTIRQKSKTKRYNLVKFSQHFYYSLYNFDCSNKIVYTLTGYDSVGVYLIFIIKPPSKALIWQSIFGCNYLSPVSWSLHNDLRLFSYLIRSLTIRAWYVYTYLILAYFSFVKSLYKRYRK